MRLMIASACLALCSLSISADEYVDSVPTTGRPIEGEIQKITFKEVTIVMPGGSGTINVSLEQINGEIVWDDTSIPPAMANGKRDMQAGNFPNAITNFGKALAASSTRTVLKQEIAFLLAQCHQQAGDFPNALAAYQKLLKDFPECFYIKKVYPALVDCAMFGGNPAQARQIITDALGKAKDLGMTDDFVGDLKLKDGQIYEQQKNWAQALNVYTGLQTSKIPKVMLSAYAGIGRCNLQLKEFDKARTAFNKVVNECDNSMPAILGSAYAGLGEIYWINAKDDLKQVKEALFCFLRVVTLYLPGPTDLTDDHARSMCYAAKCFKRLADAAAGDEKEKLMQDHFRLVGRLKDNYGKDYPAYVAEAQK